VRAKKVAKKNGGQGDGAAKPDNAQLLADGERRA
jgi:hypothetical protein